MPPLPTPHAPVVLAAVAHPDDVEFLFAGTLLLLKEAGCRIHLWNLANGCCGSMEQDREKTIHIRRAEAKAAAELAGAFHHEALFHDFEVFYDRSSLLAVANGIRSIRPQIILTHSPNDYMEDHQNVCRLIVSAAFSRGMPNFLCGTMPYEGPVRIYHAAPHGLRDGLDCPFRPDFLVDIASVMEKKRALLACHRSQHDWLKETQDMDAGLDDMTAMARGLAAGSSVEFAEGWRRHSHRGFCPVDYDPMARLLPEFVLQSPNLPEKYGQTP